MADQALAQAGTLKPPEGKLPRQRYTLRYTRLLEMLSHLPRRVVRESMMIVLLMRLFLTNRLRKSAVNMPGGPVVSLTTYGERSGKVYYAIESIARGSARPSRLLLWIDDEDIFRHLPHTLRRLQRRGLEVKLCSNYGPHKKYYPYVDSEEDFTVPLVTADDDILYPSNWLKRLIKANLETPDLICCYWAHVIELENGKIAPWVTFRKCSSTQPSSRHIAGSGAGMIFPPIFLASLKKAGAAFTTRCPQADDVWLHVQALRSGRKIRMIAPCLPYLGFQGIPGTHRTALCFDNVDKGRIDPQIRATYNEADIQLLHAE